MKNLFTKTKFAAFITALCLTTTTASAQFELMVFGSDVGACYTVITNNGGVCTDVRKFYLTTNVSVDCPKYSNTAKKIALTAGERNDLTKGNVKAHFLEVKVPLSQDDSYPYAVFATSAERNRFIKNNLPWDKLSTYNVLSHMGHLPFEPVTNKGIEGSSGNYYYGYFASEEQKPVYCINKFLLYLEQFAGYMVMEKVTKKSNEISITAKVRDPFVISGNDFLLTNGKLRNVLQITYKNTAPYPIVCSFLPLKKSTDGVFPDIKVIEHYTGGYFKLMPYEEYIDEIPIYLENNNGTIPKPPSTSGNFYIEVSAENKNLAPFRSSGILNEGVKTTYKLTVKLPGKSDAFFNVKDAYPLTFDRNETDKRVKLTLSKREDLGIIEINGVTVAAAHIVNTSAPGIVDVLIDS